MVFVNALILALTDKPGYHSRGVRKKRPITQRTVGACYQFQICTSNSMGSSEIWDKYHSC